MSIVTIAAAIVSAGIFFLTNKDIESLVNISVLGFALAASAFFYFQNKLAEVEKKIDELADGLG